MVARCKSCNAKIESICHVLFHFSIAKRIWENAGMPQPQSGFSKSSLFLNLHHILHCSEKNRLHEPLKQSFPWILWRLWKARNAWVFEKI